MGRVWPPQAGGGAGCVGGGGGGTGVGAGAGGLQPTILVFSFGDTFVGTNDGMDDGGGAGEGLSSFEPQVMQNFLPASAIVPHLLQICDIYATSLH
ncbi:MAG: hypothetical protein FWE59_05565 [Oscillospiraceae bacterium]|nr:hypothetical protein [Oscillospiraceae bacterium]